jgi:predicted MPP superfamily phosphohydrolase
MNMPSYIFFLVFFVFYAGGNLYIGLRGWQTFGQLLPLGSVRLYWLTLAFFAMSYLASRVGQRSLPVAINDLLTFAGVFWLGVLYYGLLFTLLADLIRLLDRIFPFLPVVIKQQSAFVGLTVLCLVMCTLVYGAWNARHPIVNRYDITIPKSGRSLTSLHAVAVSDIHLGNIIGASRLEELVASINSLNPDIVLLVGDTIDAELQPFLSQNMGEILHRLKPPLGVYAVLGNHEYIGKETEETVIALEQAGVIVLRDRKVLINDSFILAGRDEYSRDRYGNRSRAPLSAVLAGVDPSLPILLLDHQPVNLNEAMSQGADLQLSGHTHRGQFYPNNLITSAIFEIDWGYLKKESLQVIVSSGWGTWGPPIRTGNTPELLDLHIKFQQ